MRALPLALPQTTEPNRSVLPVVAFLPGADGDGNAQAPPARLSWITSLTIAALGGVVSIALIRLVGA